MKLYRFFSVAVAALTLFAACEKENHEIDNQNKDQAKPTAAVSIVSAVDDTLTFKVSAAGKDVRSYGYVVLEGTGNPAPSAYEIVVDEVSGAYDSNVFDFADTNENEVKIEAPSYGEFEIFAAAITKTGLLGEVVKAEAVVGDEINPEILDYDYEDNEAVFYLLMSEPVKYVEGKEITATLYAGIRKVNSSKTAYAYYYADESMAMGKATAKVSVEDDVVMLDFGEQIPGTMYAVDVPDGAFEDYSGNLAEGIDSKVTYDSTTETNTFDGLVGLMAYGTYAATPANEIPKSLMVTEWDQWFQFSAPQYLAGGGAAKGTAVYISSNGGTKTTREVEMQAGMHFGVLNISTIGVKLPEQPAVGESVTVTIPAGVISDVYGNTNDEIKFGPILFIAEPFKVNITADEIIYSSASVHLVPNELEIPYYWSYVEADAVKGVKDEDIYAADLAYYQKAYGSTFSKYGYSSFEDLFVANFCSVGKLDEVLSGLDPETKYLVYACSLKDDLSMDSELFKYEFTTPAKPAATNEYASILGAYTCPVYDYFDEKNATSMMVVEEGIVNETFEVYFADGLTPISGNYVDAFTATFDQATKSLTLANPSVGSEGETWNFGSLGYCSIYLESFFYNSSSNYEKLTLAKGTDGKLSLTYPAVPAADYVCLQAGIYSGGASTGYANGIYVFTGGMVYTPAATGPSAAPASCNGTVARRTSHLKEAKYFTAKKAYNR